MTEPLMRFGACFPANAKAVLHTGRAIRMSAVQVGDRVRVADGGTSMVFSFSHRDARTRSTFTTLHTARGNLTVSEGHFVYTGLGDLRAAGAIHVGDWLMTDGAGLARVLAVSQVSRDGLFNPHTFAHELVVDGFRVSSYTLAMRRTSAVSLLTPVRALFRVFHVDLFSRLLSKGAPFPISRLIRQT